MDMRDKDLQPGLEPADIECLVACCSSLQVLDLNYLPDNSASALTRLPGLTSLTFGRVRTFDEQCSSLAQLTALRELRVGHAYWVTAAGLLQLAALDQLTCLSVKLLLYDDDSPVQPKLSSEELPSHMCAIINQVWWWWWGVVCVAGRRGLQHPQVL